MVRNACREADLIADTDEHKQEEGHETRRQDCDHRLYGQSQRAHADVDVDPREQEPSGFAESSRG